ncbi:LysM peptidoglycan-binding domain-containing protein [Azovibrio restrictus]|uniref:LysM peptidoglycan-binding domain-containing protein n=1 Tax=Azovibrio restrictus TaxID=146938 RepID=UPI0026F06AD1|nr:LysM peptidoglycan-binding domain-containing protein [Azovibrio restrictus]
MKLPRGPIPSASASLQALLLTLACALFAPGAGASPEQPPLPREELVAPPSLTQTVDLTAPTEDLWVRIRNGFAMPNLNDELVLRHQQYYQSRPEGVRRMVERSRPYLHHIVDELERRGMPTELALLPMVESAYNPMAYSPAHASGLWQFIPSTGRNFNLEQNWWHDQRRDIVASTSAALDYLQHIYELHGDWHLALASYNWGEGAVGRAIARNEAKGLPTDYGNLSMPQETRHYVPKLQALKNIFSNPRLMAELRLPSIPNRPYFRTVVTEAPIDIKLAAQFAGLSVEEFVALNPAHHRPVIQPESILVIPADQVESFKAGLAAHDEPLSNWKTYALQPGEQLEQVAPRFGITLADLKRVNGLQGRIRVQPGQTLLVPAQEEDARSAPATLLPPALPVLAEIPATPAQFHTVKKGETLHAIARKYGISTTELRELNKLRGGKLSAGTRLKVKAGATAVARNQVTKEAPAPQASRQNQADKVADAGSRKKPGKSSGPKVTHHKVKKGDTLFSIARRYNVELDDLKRWNKLAGNNLKVGSTLTIRLDS